MTTHLAQTGHSILSTPSDENIFHCGRWEVKIETHVQCVCGISCKLPDTVVRSKQKSDHFNEFQDKSYVWKVCDNLVLEQTDKHGSVQRLIFASLRCEPP